MRDFIAEQTDFDRVTAEMILTYKESVDVFWSFILIMLIVNQFREVFSLIFSF